MFSVNPAWLLQCCSCHKWDTSNDAELQLLCDTAPIRLGNAESKKMLDITCRPFDLDTDQMGYMAHMPWTSLTPRQQNLRDQLEMPSTHLTASGFPPGKVDEPEEVRIKHTLQLYQEFTLNLHTGMYLTHLTSDFQYTDIHCQLMEDLCALKIDQGDGNIVEFPLTAVSRVRRLMKYANKWYSTGTFGPEQMPPTAEHVIIVEFVRHKLPFVFKDICDAKRFKTCMELLVRRAQQELQDKSHDVTLQDTEHGRCRGVGQD